jgi:tripeptide aminopeptidase
LKELAGKTLITTDGHTLLGGDDKAGVAVIMETAQWLVEHPEVPHGPVKVLFTCDEEIGRGVKHVDVKRLGATVCYTLDGSGAGLIDVETFSADLATVVIRGVNIHPSIAKDRMVNSIRAAAEFIARLPRDVMAPEVTSGRDGFLHPYQLEGGVAQTRLKILLRDFDTANLARQAELLHSIATKVESRTAGVKVEVQITRQYRNMAEGLRREPRAVSYAQEAFRRLGKEAKLDIVRGGTDGSQLTELGLPTPNLSTGQHNIHSPLEFACLDEMVEAGRVLVELVKIWAEEK